MNQQPLPGKIRELVLKGDLILDRAAALKAEMQASLESAEQLQINLTETSAVDLSFLQLLCSAHRSAVQSNKSLRLTGQIPEDFYRKLQESGFGRHVGCRHDCQSSCIWMTCHE
jgi:ABC-type transporter Mla MlaB component